ncbi:PREDICTED: WUSCHEL-related homeobox 11 isoform X3 [Brassica oleracea var. oleracea]|uniref:WUSCHEL-related homeobox 11 isoform X3 n=1 Tax=Brassica oleracea var. oleracea TaxID=109376 RepID=UPI0006A6B94D|nr:PREDICTED: WUSCHEL-related homeobox 11 isoform X3 [Brassica oleracea var. oleracea]
MDQEQTQHSPTGHSHSPSSPASGSTSTETVRSRWSPKPEQILILESIFNSGMVNPPKEETVRIRKMLEKFGAVGDANVFYWFQNRRSRSRRRQRQLQAAAAAAAVTTNTCDQTMMVNTSLPQYSGADLGFGGCSTSSNYLYASSSTSSYGGGCDNHINNGMENLLAMSGQMGYHEASQHHYQHHSSNLSPMMCPSDQSSSYDHYQQGLTVFINGVPTEVTSGGIDMKAMFGEDLVLVHSSGVPLPTDEFGFLMHSLQHGEAYFLVPRQT